MVKVFAITLSDLQATVYKVEVIPKFVCLTEARLQTQIAQKLGTTEKNGEVALDRVLEDRGASLPCLVPRGAAGRTQSPVVQ